MAIAIALLIVCGCPQPRASEASVESIPSSADREREAEIEVPESGDASTAHEPTNATTEVDPLVAAIGAQAPKLVVLGNAQDAGVPQAGCDCARCRAAIDDPRTRPRVASAALVLADGRTLLVDATPDIAWQLRDVAALRREAPDARRRRPVEGILLTHGHAGHYLGLAQLGFEAAHTDRVMVHGSARMLSLLRDHAPWSELVRREELALHELQPQQPLVLGEVSVRPVLVPHRDELTDTLAFRFEGPRRTVLYLPDCAPWPRWDPAAREALFRGVDVALVDGTFYSADELPGRDLDSIGHPLMVDTMDWIEGLPQAPEVRFLHLNHSNPALEANATAREELRRRGFAVAERGTTLPL